MSKHGKHQTPVNAAPDTAPAAPSPEIDEGEPMSDLRVIKEHNASSEHTGTVWVVLVDGDKQAPLVCLHPAAASVDPVSLIDAIERALSQLGAGT